jgi:5-formyltetrahydrofolate cyclo-ligase
MDERWARRVTRYRSSVMQPLDTAGRRAAIRVEMRSRRASLDDDDQAAAAMAVLARLARMAIVREARLAAGYNGARGEVEIAAAMILLAEQGVTITTPRVRGDHIEFIVTDETTPMTIGSFGIPEPAEGEIVTVDRHDLILVPLVAFDSAGRRLGQGGGFYDRALADTVRRPFVDRPALIGIAHAFQQVGELPMEPWDVPLDAIVTEEGIVEVTAGAGDRVG